MPANSLTIVLPAYNEVSRLGPALDELFGYLRRDGPGRAGLPGPAFLPRSITILIVDDGSTDGTADLVRARAETKVGTPDRPMLELLTVPHGGKGAAVRAGMLAATGDLVVFADADMATPPDQLPLLTQALQDHDVALGSRIQPDGRDMRRSQPAYRRALGRVFHAIASAWVAGPVRDTQCGFKGFTRAAACDLFAIQRVTSIVFDVELIYLARRRGYQIAVVPIEWSDRRGSRMRARPGLALTVLWDLFRIPLIHRRLPGRPIAATSTPPAPPTPSLSGVAAPPAQTAAQRWLPPVATAAFTLGVVLILAVAGSTLGYDYQAYVGAAQRLLDGLPLYDPSVEFAGPFAIFLYPAPFALAMIPFALLPDQVGLWAWLLGLIACFLAGTALLPVSARTRWLVVLLAGLSWPFLYSVKLGQVGPLLFLVFALGWRWLDRPAGLGVSMAVGALVKIQPALLFGWAFVTGRRRAVAIGAVVVLVAAAVATPFIGLSGWVDYVELLRRVNTPVTTPHNFTPGAIAYQLGASEAAAGLIQLATYGIAIAAAVWAWFRTDAVTSYVVTIVASQLLSPVLWDHYAMLLLVPTALMLERRWWWAVVIPLGGWLPAAIYPVLFFVALLAPIAGAARDGRPTAGRVVAAPAGTAA